MRGKLAEAALRRRQGALKLLVRAFEGVEDGDAVVGHVVVL